MCIIDSLLIVLKKKNNNNLICFKVSDKYLGGNLCQTLKFLYIDV